MSYLCLVNSDRGHYQVLNENLEIVELNIDTQRDMKLGYVFCENALLEWNTNHTFSEFKLGNSVVKGIATPLKSNIVDEQFFRVSLSIDDVAVELDVTKPRNIQVFFKKIDNIFSVKTGYYCFVASEYGIPTSQDRDLGECFARQFRLIILNRDKKFVAVTKPTSYNSDKIEYEYCSDARLASLAKLKTPVEIGTIIMM